MTQKFDLVTYLAPVFTKPPYGVHKEVVRDYLGSLGYDVKIKHIDNPMFMRGSTTAVQEIWTIENQNYRVILFKRIQRRDMIVNVHKVA